MTGISSSLSYKTKDIIDPARFSAESINISRRIKYFAFYFNTKRLVTLEGREQYNRWTGFDNCKIYHNRLNKVIMFQVPEGQLKRVKQHLNHVLSGYDAEALSLHLAHDFSDFCSGIKFIIDGFTKVGSVSNKLRTSLDFIDDVTEDIRILRPSVSSLLPKFLSTLLDIYSLYKNCDIFSVAKSLLSFYNLFTDYKVVFPESFDALFLSTCSIFLPSKLFEVFKRLSIFSNSKMLDDMHVLDSLISIVHDFVKQTLIFFNFNSYIDFFDNIFSYLPFGKKMIYTKEMRSCVSRTLAEPKCLSDKTFRIQVNELNSKLNRDIDFMEWCKRSSSISSLKSDFDRLVKNVKGYERATRTEPNCFVFEGPPGCKKSLFTGKLCELLTCKDSMTVYSHLVKAITDGKDWYDSYNNEDIFLMDDVGQQGISQWRTLINMVSSLRLPLDCADAKLKDTKFFCSDTIILTTNKFSELQGFNKTDCISDPHALWRRGFVFNFDQVIMNRSTGLLTGNIVFRYYDIDQKAWIEGFPAYVETTLPTTCDSSNELYTLAWMRQIILLFKNYKSKFATDTVLTASQVEVISQFFEKPIIADKAEEEFYDAETYSIYDHASESLQDIVNMFSDFKEYLYSLIPDLIIEKKLISLTIISIFFGMSFYYLKGLLLPHQEITPEAKYERLKNLFIAGPAPTTDVAAVQRNIKDITLKCTNATFKATAILSGHYAIVPAHMAFEENCLMQVMQDSVKNLVLLDFIPVTRVFIDNHSDVAIYRMPSKNLTPFKSLSHFFIPKEIRQDSYLLSSMGVIPLINQLKHDDYNTIYYSNAPEGYKAFKNFVAKTERLDYNISYPTLCGSPVFDGSIRGMHVAGNGVSGTSVIWSNRIIQTIHKILEDDKYILPMEFKNIKESENLSATQVEYKFSESTPKHSNYAPTKVFGVFPVEREPANMLYDGPHTVKTLMRKNMSINKPLDLPLYKEAAKGFDCFFQPYGKCTDQEIVDGFDLIAQVNSKTSNGMFYDGEKKQYIDYDNKCFRPEFRQHLQDLEESILKGNLPAEFVFVKSTLKDEVRDMSKQGKPRAFQVMPVSLQMLTKKYFAKFVQNIIKTRTFHKVCVGINPYKEWDSFYNNLKNHKSFAMDFPDWDGNMLAAAQDIICEKIMNYYSGSSDERIIAEVVLRTIIVKIIVCNDDGYLVSHGLPSGSFLTAILNSLVNLLNGMAWYLKQTGKPIATFFQKVDYYTYGDDNVTTVKDPTLYTKLNALTYRDFLREIGINCTTADKKEVLEEFDTLENISFLKRKFVFSHDLNKVVGALDPKSLLTGLNWYDSSSGDTADKILHDKIACFQREAFLHGPQFYQAKVEHLKKYADNNGVAFDELPYSYLLRLYQLDDPSFCEPLMSRYRFNLVTDH
jgi:hypothetical protein